MSYVQNKSPGKNCMYISMVSKNELTSENKKILEKIPSRRTQVDNIHRASIFTFTINEPWCDTRGRKGRAMAVIYTFCHVKIDGFLIFFYFHWFFDRVPGQFGLLQWTTRKEYKNVHNKKNDCNKLNCPTIVGR